MAASIRAALCMRARLAWLVVVLAAGGLGPTALAQGALGVDQSVVEKTPPTAAEAPAAPAGAWTVEVAPADPLPGASRVASDRGAIVHAIDVTSDGAGARVTLAHTGPLSPQVFTLGEPYRVVVELPDVRFQLPPSAGMPGGGASAKGLVTAFRHGLFAPGRARIVIDTAGPVRVDKVDVAAPGATGGGRIAILLSPIPAAEFVATAPAALALKASLPPDDLPDPARLPSAKPVIVIDPGHGGIDSGAMSAGVMGASVQEKDIVLAVSQQLRAFLEAGGRYDVRMTRHGDVFVALEQRVALSRKAGAGLFVSIHADAIAAKEFARNIRGATVYTLAERASDEQARRLAEKENASDILAGVKVTEAAEDGDVMGILLDLMRRESAELSAQFQGTLVEHLRRDIAMAKDPKRGAAFRVLKQSHTAAVLIELGYMSNDKDESLLRSPDWQRQVAGAIAAAVDRHFTQLAERGR